MSRKIRDAEKEWIPYIVVVGEKERKEKKVTPRIRKPELGAGEKAYTLKELYEAILPYIQGFPQQKLPLSLYLSKRPKFKG